MPAFRHGSTTTVLFKQFDLSNQFREFNAQLQMDVADTTAFKSTVKTFVPGIIAGRLQLNGMFSAGSVSDVANAFETAYGVAVPPVITIGPDGDMAVGKRIISGIAHEASFAVQGSVTDMVATQAEFQATDGINSGFSLWDPTTNNAAPGNTTPVAASASVDFGTALTAAQSAGGYACLHVLTSTTAAGTYQVSVQDSADNNTFAPVTGFAVNFTSVGAGVLTSERIRIPVGIALRRYVKAYVTWQSGTTGAMKMQVGFVRFGQLA